MQKCRMDVSEKRKSLRHPFLNQYFKYKSWGDKDGKVVNPNSYYRHILHKLFICFIIDVLSCLEVIFVIASFYDDLKHHFYFVSSTCGGSSIYVNMLSGFHDSYI